MDLLIKLRNKKTGAISEVPAKLWQEKKQTNDWKHVFEEVETIKEPAEVTALKARLKTK